MQTPDHREKALGKRMSIDPGCVDCRISPKRSTTNPRAIRAREVRIQAMRVLSAAK